MKINSFQKNKNLKFLCQESLQNKWHKRIHSLHFGAGHRPTTCMLTVIVSADLEWSKGYPRNYIEVDTRGCSPSGKWSRTGQGISPAGEVRLKSEELSQAGEALDGFKTALMASKPLQSCQ